MKSLFPSRELTYPTWGTRKINKIIFKSSKVHFWGWYVSSQEGKSWLLAVLFGKFGWKVWENESRNETHSFNPKLSPAQVFRCSQHSTMMLLQRLNREIHGDQLKEKGFKDGVGWKKYNLCGLLSCGFDSRICDNGIPLSTSFFEKNKYIGRMLNTCFFG